MAKLFKYASAFAGSNSLPMMVCLAYVGPALNSMPSIAYPEFVRMHLDGQEVGYKEWTVHPISDDDLFIDIPVDKVFNV